MFKGYKTYITAGLAILGAVAGYLVEDLTLAQAAQMVVTAVLGMTVRDAINSGVSK